jgi:hypothetical protein
LSWSDVVNGSGNLMQILLFQHEDMLLVINHSCNECYAVSNPKAQLGNTYKARQILNEVQKFFLKTGAMTMPLQAI